LAKQDAPSRLDITSILAIKNNNEKSGYSQHILNTGHSYGCLKHTLEILNIEHKAPYLNMLDPCNMILSMLLYSTVEVILTLIILFNVFTILTINDVF
jgi:hypothetical protein